MILFLPGLLALFPGLTACRHHLFDPQHFFARKIPAFGRNPALFRDGSLSQSDFAGNLSPKGSRTLTGSVACRNGKLAMPAPLPKTREVFHVLMVKPTRYGDDGYPVQWIACTSGVSSPSA
jgi:hypothetical protein